MLRKRNFRLALATSSALSVLVMTACTTAETAQPAAGATAASATSTTAAATTPASAPAAPAAPVAQGTPGKPRVQDPYLAAWLSLTPDRAPAPLKPGVDYGMDPATGEFVWPKATPEVHKGQPFPGEMTKWDKKSFTKNVEVLAFYPGVDSPFHAWNNVADFDGHRYLYIHDRDYLRIMDVTDPAHGKVVFSSGGVWGPKGPSERFDANNVQDYLGGATIAWNKKLGKPVLVASFEIGRYGLMTDKSEQPDKVAAQRHYNSLKGFKVFAMNGPLPSQWELLATRTTDYKHPDAPIGQQQGSGSLDAPEYYGGKYMILSSAPDDTYGLTEYPNYLYSPGYQVWDMSDPANPKFVSQFSVPGQILGKPEDEQAYLMNPRAGNRTSWMGSRIPVFLPKPLEAGGKIGFGAMGGLGLYSFDLSAPANPKVLGHVNTPPSFAGTEYDNADVSQYARTGYVLTNGYPMNRDCYEPYKDIFVVDARDPSHMKVATTLPRPTPPEGASYTSFCQRGGNFGPKRANAIGQPGGWRQGIVPYSFYNAGVQIYDVRNPEKPTIAGYFVPALADETELPSYTLGKGVFAIYTEYDRNIIWAFTENGAYALSTPLLGKPVMGPAAKPWPAR
ncbi:LVIVD repeat-containing protein [Paraburkholderia saeva]|uniref:LVIVD repeat-containing protein n=1 Tax=Paraburkholderia saeva TaxID=2777537 RepID=A0A9N8S1C8_9BURK|nr:hypothetical protein [Paraburkholderia saeva]CAG4927800.1 hypothetical protein LMG31841_05739 [Paraburkholderia saeva]